MHRDQRTRQARLGQACQQALGCGAFFRVVNQPAQQLQQQHFKQSVCQQPLAAAHLLGLGKQQGQRVLQTLHA